MDLKVKEADAPTLKIVEISGDIDGKTAPQVQEQLSALAKQGGRLILDMSKVAFMASAGLRVLLAISRQLQAGQNFILVGFNQHIRETLTITGFIDLFTCFDSLEEGLAAAR